MDAVLYLKELERLETTDSKLYSQELMMTDKTFEERVAFVEQWSKEHPKKTRMQDFLEKFPKALMNNWGKGEHPKVCCLEVGYTNKCPMCKDCLDCWNKLIDS